MKTERSNRLSIVKVVVLTVLTLGLYSAYLFYNNIKVLKEYSKEKISKAFILLYFIPIVRFYLLYSLPKRTSDMLNLNKKKSNKLIMLVLGAYIFNRGVNRVVEGFDIPLMIGLVLVSLVVVGAIFAYYQKQINKFLEKKEKNKKYRIMYPGEVIFVAPFFLLGIVVLFLYAGF